MTEASRLTVFPRATLDRESMRWEDHLHALTPVEMHGGLRFKREDYCAPLGYGGINGSKLRQCIWLVHQYTQRGVARPGLLSAASVKSPQLSMGTAVARHFGLPVVLVLGATNPVTAIRHENVAIAAWLGAQFRFAKVAYNPALQQSMRKLGEHPDLRDYFRLEYGITVHGPDDAIEQFHRLGSEQVRNLPDDVETLVVPAGSCNSCVSVLYGIARFRPASLRRVILVGIGPTRLGFIEDRLRAIERVSGVMVRTLFAREYRQHPAVADLHNKEVPSGAPMRLVHVDLHTLRWASYQDEMPWSHGGIAFHPTYEGKVMRYMAEHRDDFPEVWSGRAMVWIVGSRPTRDAMRTALTAALGRAPPVSVPVWQAA